MLLSEATGQTGGFAPLDWGVIVVYLLLTTLVGARLAGRQSTIRDFFLAGRKLPWWAICGSIIATEISAVTFVAVPTISFLDGGNLTYLQLAIGAVLARVIIGIWLVPRYFQSEIYSPYDYMGERLGDRVKKVTTALFSVGAVLGQGARVYVTAFVLGVITGLPLVTSIWIIGAVAVGWTLLGGMTTVIWTDVIQFLVLTIGALVALGYSITAVPGSLSEVISAASEAGKFQCIDLSTDLSLPYTIWCGFLAAPFLNLAAFGTDQVMAQRMFCCRDQRDAKRAIIVSSVGIALALLMLCVGIALYSYFEHNPFTPQEKELYETKNTYLLPIFIVRALPAGIRGLIVAAVFASAISTLDSTLAALSQTTVSAFIKPRPARRKKRTLMQGLLASEIGLSKVLVIGWGAVLCLMATACIAIAGQYANAVDLALALVGYTYGPLLGILLLALLGMKRDDAGLVWAVPMTLLAVFGMSHHDLIVGPIGPLPALDLADWIVWTGAAVVLLLGLYKAGGEPERVAAVAVGALVIVALHRFQVGVGTDGAPVYPAFMWNFPVGTVMTFVLGYCLGRPKRDRERSGATERKKKTVRQRPRSRRPAR